MRNSNYFPSEVIGGGQIHQLTPEKPAKDTLINRIAARLYRWYSIARERRQLAEMSDWMLKDIGISRADADREASRHFWDDP